MDDMIKNGPNNEITEVYEFINEWSRRYVALLKSKKSILVILGLGLVLLFLHLLGEPFL